MLTGQLGVTGCVGWPRSLRRGRGSREALGASGPGFRVMAANGLSPKTTTKAYAHNLGFKNESNTTFP